MTAQTRTLPATRAGFAAGLWDWVTTVDHKKIGILYLATTFGFFLAGGIMALILRAQLAVSNLKLVSPQLYNQIFTMHGTTMVFLVVIPIFVGFGNYFVPLMVGARDMAFPRLNALSYWLLLFGGLTMFSSFLIGQAPNAGWTAYPPLSGAQFTPGHNTDFWILGLHMVGISSILGAINILVTGWNMRAPGMRMMDVPMFVWSFMVTSLMVVFATPMVTTAITLLLLDRYAGTSYFVASQGGDPLLWQNLFWFYSHPAVYIMILPAMGIVSEVLPVFSRKPLFGYNFIAWSSVFIAIFGFSVWAHHMFTVGASLAVDTFFMAASMAIAVPTGIKIFNWIGTMWGGALRLKTPLLFAVGFIALFIVGGLSGVTLAVVPVDWQVHDTYFVVAHLHYVLFGGSVFGFFAGFYYWLPKITGRLMDERLGRWHFWLMLVGFNLTFFPMHIMGLLGMPRRIYTYAPGQGWDTYNLIATIGAFTIAIAVTVFMVNFLRTLRHGEPAGNDPWGGASLEWSTSSPPPAYNFETIPTVHGRDPLWAGRPGAPVPADAPPDSRHA